MPRNDSMLYSGSSSASFATPKIDIRQEIKDTKKKDKQILSPVSELILGELQKEIDALAIRNHTVVKALIASGIPHALEVDELANALASDRLVAIKTRMTNIMRAK